MCLSGKRFTDLTFGCQGEGIVRSDGDVQTAIFKMIVNKDLPYSTGNYSRLCDSLREGSLRENRYYSICG